MSGQSLFEKIWQRHLVSAETPQAPAVLYIDLHLLHEVTSPQAFAELERRGLAVRRPDRCLATIDHSTPTLPAGSDGRLPYVSAEAEAQVETLYQNCRAHNIRLCGWGDPHRGIVHVIGPELGATRPGMTIVCGDSHTSTHGAFGALAFGIGTTEVGHVLATQCLLQRKPGTMRIDIDGDLPAGVGAKDVILHIIGAIGVDGGTGKVIEYAGSAVRNMSMEARMTLCNMSIECGARAGMVAPDEVTFDYLKGRPLAPGGDAWDQYLLEWKALHSDSDASFDEVVCINAADIQPTVTYGTHPGMTVAVRDSVPAANGNASDAKALKYMGVEGGQAMQDMPVDVVFIGSCTNGRISDLRQAASVLKNRRIKPGTRTLIVPGSEQVKRQAEAEGLDRIFIQAGAEWREPGCSMCIAMNGDLAAAGERVVSTSNRNFEGRQGRGARTMLASPLTAAACAVSGRISDPRQFLDSDDD